MPERRESPRVPVNKECTLSIEGREIRTTIENISETGGLFHVLETDAVSNDDLGSEAEFVLSTVKPARQYTGELIRLYFLEGAHHLVMRFWKKYKELA